MPPSCMGPASGNGVEDRVDGGVGTFVQSLVTATSFCSRDPTATDLNGKVRVYDIRHNVGNDTTTKVSPDNECEVISLTWLFTCFHIQFISLKRQKIDFNSIKRYNTVVFLFYMKLYSPIMATKTTNKQTNKQPNKQKKTKKNNDNSLCNKTHKHRICITSRPKIQ